MSDEVLRYAFLNRKHRLQASEDLEVTWEETLTAVRMDKIIDYTMSSHDATPVQTRVDIVRETQMSFATALFAPDFIEELQKRRRLL